MLLKHACESTLQASSLVCELSFAGALRSLLSSRSMLPKMSFSLVSLLRSLQKKYEPRLAAKWLKLQFEWDAAAACRVHGDATMLRHAHRRMCSLLR